jgi:hypothetical protein
MKLTICSLCLRVQRGRSWVDAEQVIHELRSYERSDCRICVTPSVTTASTRSCAGEGRPSSRSRLR